MRAGELIYAVLGTQTSTELLQALRAWTMTREDTAGLNTLVHQLESCIGGAPSMLHAIATSAGATQRLLHHWPESEDERSELRWHLAETMKHFGSLVLEAAQQFGFDETRFRAWYEDTPNLFDLSNWPPRGVGYVPFELPSEPPRGHVHDALPDARSDILRAIIKRYCIEEDWTGEEWNGDGADLLNQEDARLIARLTASTAQWWHWRLAQSLHRPSTVTDDDEFTFRLLGAMTEFDPSSWTLLTSARRTCFVADLAEILWMMLVFGPSQMTRRVQEVLVLVCEGHPALLDIAEHAASALPFRESESRFAEAFAEVRGRC